MAVGENLWRLKDDVCSKPMEVMPEAPALSWLALAEPPFPEMLEFSGSPPDPLPLLLDCMVREEEMPLSWVEPT